MRKIALALAIALFAAIGLPLPGRADEQSNELLFNIWKQTGQLTRGVTVSGTFTPNTSYAVNNDMGGLITVATGLLSGTRVTITKMSVSFNTTSISGAGNPVALLFDSLPGATVADGATPTWAAGDPAKLVYLTSLGANNITGSASTIVIFEMGSPTLPIDLTVDGSGNIYLILQMNGTLAPVGPGTATWRVVVRY